MPVVAFFVGLVASGSSWFALHDTTVPFPYSYAFRNYGGNIQDHTPESRTFTLIVPSYFSPDTSSRVMRFTYDDDTLWAATTFILSHDVVTKREVAIGKPFTLPPGTYVSVFRDVEQSQELRADSILVLKRHSI